MPEKAKTNKEKRQDELFGELVSALGSHAFETSVVYRSGRYDIMRKRYDIYAELCIEMLKNSGRFLVPEDGARRFPPLELKNIMGFHKETVQPLASNFLGWANTNLGASELKIFGDIKQREASGTIIVENIRLYHAFYRFQFCCNLYRVIKTHVPMDFKKGRSNFDTFFGRLEPQELKELLIVQRFAMEICKSFIAKAGVTDSPLGSRLACAFLFGNGVPVTEEEIGESKNEDGETYIIRGLVVLKRLYSQELTHEDIKNFVSRLQERRRRVGPLLHKLFHPSKHTFEGGANAPKRSMYASLSLDAESKDDWKFMESIFQGRLST